MCVSAIASSPLVVHVRRRQMEAQEAQARVQLQAQNLAKLSRRPEEVLRDLEQEAEVLKNLHHKISQQLHMLQVRTSKASSALPRWSVKAMRSACTLALPTWPRAVPRSRRSC